MGNIATDADLLARFTRDHAQDAFTELVKRYLNLVYSAALRQVRSPQLAEEIAQSVFSDLARAAGKLKPDTVLVAWLHSVTRRTAVDIIRKEARHRLREQIAVEFTAMNATESCWLEIEPMLDEAVAALDELDRAAVLLRYFENKSLREVGAALGVSDDAAQKRVSRAVERLREFFSKRNVTVGASGLTILISANAVQSAPAALLATISAAAFAGTAVTTSTAIAATKAIAMTTLQKTLVTITVTVLAGAGIYEAHKASKLRDRVQTLQRQQSPLTADVTRLRTENQRLSNLVAAANEQKKITKAQLGDLLRLRSQSSHVQTEIQELEKTRTAVNQQSQTKPDFMTNAIAHGLAMAERSKKKEIAARVARMKAELHLSDDQAQAVSEVMLRYLDENTQRLFEAMSGGHVNLAQWEPQKLNNEDDEIKALLSPEQLSGYDAFKEADRVANATSSAQAEIQRMTDELALSPDQQERIRSLLVQNALNKKPSPQNDAVAQARAVGNMSSLLDLKMKEDEKHLEEKLQLVSAILTPEQLQKYQQSQMDNLKTLHSALKMFMPPTNSTPTQ